MSIASAVSTSRLANRATRRAVARRTPTAIGVGTLLLAPLRVSGAQAAAARTSDSQQNARRDGKWELRFTSGALVSTGVQRNTLADAQLSAAQLSWLVRRWLAVSRTRTPPTTSPAASRLAVSWGWGASGFAATSLRS